MVKINSGEMATSREMTFVFPLSRQWQNSFPVETLMSSGQTKMPSATLHDLFWQGRRKQRSV
jgi:hypothetical protein